MKCVKIAGEVVTVIAVRRDVKQKLETRQVPGKRESRNHRSGLAECSRQWPPMGAWSPDSTVGDEPTQVGDRSVACAFNGMLREAIALACCVLTLLASRAIPSSAQDVDSVLYRIRIDRDYSRSTNQRRDRETARALTLVARALPPRIVRIAEQLTLHQLLLREYGVSVGPRARSSGTANVFLFDSLARIVDQLNANVDRSTNRVAPGTVLVPSLPFNGALISDLRAVQGDAQWLDPSTLQELPAATGKVVRALPAGSYLFDRESDARFVSRVVPLAAFGDASRLAEFGEVNSVQYDIIDFPLDVYFDLPTDEKGRAEVPDSFAVKPIADAWMDAATRQSRTGGLMVVVDLGWPDVEAYSASCASIRDLLRRVSISWRLSPLEPDPCASRTLLEHTPAHPRLINEALAGLRARLPNAVEVVYFPILRDSLSAPLQTALLRVSEELRLKHENYAATIVEGIGPTCTGLSGARRCAMANALSSTQRASALSSAESLATRIHSTFPKDETNMRLIGLASLLNALFRVLDEDARQQNRGVVVNTSWTADPGDNYGLREPDGDERVLVVAAAGNDDVEVMSRGLRLEYARRANGTNGVLAVVNGRENGSPQCKSNYFRGNAGAAAFAVALSGYVRDSVCATSFAAPRVSWILAAAEALNPSRPADDWRRQVVCRIRGAMMPQNGSLAPALDGAKYLREVCKR